MKRILLTIIALCLFIGIYGQNNDPAKEKEAIKWYTFSEAIALQKENPKKIFVDIYTDWCGWCTKMDVSTFVDPSVVETLGNYYCVKFNAESGDPVDFRDQTFVNPNTGKRRSTHQLAALLLQNKMSYPSFALIGEDQELITVLKGYLTPEQINPVLDYISQDLYQTDKSWEEFLIEYKQKDKQ